jgi:hypothetical protein
MLCHEWQELYSLWCILCARLRRSYAYRFFVVEELSEHPPSFMRRHRPHFVQILTARVAEAHVTVFIQLITAARASQSSQAFNSVVFVWRANDPFLCLLWKQSGQYKSSQSGQ